MQKDTNCDDAIDFLVIVEEKLEHIRTEKPFDLIDFAKKNSWLIKAIQFAELNPSQTRLDLLSKIEQKAQEENIRV